MENNLQNGITAFKTGQHEIARKYIHLAIVENPQNENAWRWAYKTALNQEERTDCLKHIARLNSKDPQVWYRMDQLLILPEMRRKYHLTHFGKHESISLPGLMVYILGGLAFLLAVITGGYLAYMQWVAGF